MGPHPRCLPPPPPIRPPLPPRRRLTPPRSAGIEYNLIRVPMGCSDFSTRPYSYDDVPDDFELRHFALAEEDLEMKVGVGGGVGSVGGRWGWGVGLWLGGDL